MTVLTDVKDLGELLTGAALEQARVAPDGGRLRFEIELTRAMTERQQAARPGLFKRARTPWTKCQLTLTGISDVTVKWLAGGPPDQLPLLSADAVKDGYQLTVQTPDGLQFVLGAEKLEGSFRDIGSPIEAP